MNADIYSYVLAEEKKFETEHVKVADNWTWNFREHVQLIFHLKNGVFTKGQNDWLRAFKNIMEPLLNLSYWSEDIELKDVVFYIEEKTGRVLSFLLKKYHDEVFVKENNLDTMFDEITESDLDYGGALVQKTTKPKPEVLKLTKVAFCDQTDMLGGPLGLKFHFSPSKLRTMSQLGWGSDANGASISIEELIVLAEATQTPAGQMGIKNVTPGKTIEVYLVRGDLPEGYLLDNDDMEYYCPQLQIVAFYTDKNSKKQGVTLYRKKDTGENLKFFTSKEIENRALGRGVGESLLHQQVWTNFLEIHKMGMLEAGSKVPLFTDDEGYADRNRIQNMENLEITTIKSDSKYGIRQVPTVAPANVQLFEKSIDTWYQHGQLAASAFDPMLGKELPSGTTFRGQERSVAQGRGMHDLRRGKRAKFIEELYREWIIPAMVKEIVKGKTFLATLSTAEMTWVMDKLSDTMAARKQLNEMLADKPMSDGAALKQQALTELSKHGTQHLLQILEGEFKDIEIRMGINVANKQKNLADLSDKVMSILQSAIANPVNFQMAMKLPGMAAAFNDVLEFSGISQVDFAAIANMPLPQAPDSAPNAPQPQPSPVEVPTPTA